MTLGILVICTANRFRSPLAAAVLAARLRELPVAVSSRGTLDVGLLPPLMLARQSATELGVDISKHRARLLQREDFATADLVLGFEAHHLQAAREAGAEEQSLFAISDAVEIFRRVGRRPDAEDYVASSRAIVAEADSARDRLAPAIEVDDPITKPHEEALAIGRRVQELASELAELLVPAAS